MERVSDEKEIVYRTFDEVLMEKLCNAEFASAYLGLALPDAPRMIVDRIQDMIRAGVDFSLIDPSVIDRVNDSLAAASVPMYWRKAA